MAVRCENRAVPGVVRTLSPQGFVARSTKGPVSIGFCTQSQAFMTHKLLHDADISSNLAKGHRSVRSIYKCRLSEGFPRVPSPAGRADALTYFLDVMYKANQRIPVVKDADRFNGGTVCTFSGFCR